MCWYCHSNDFWKNIVCNIEWENLDFYKYYSIISPLYKSFTNLFELKEYIA